MVMTINGTSGITFPDTSIQAVTATNASNITTGTLPKERLAAGTLLQVRTNQVIGRTVGTNSFLYTTSALGSPSSTTGSKFLEVASFAPLSATSLILIQVCSNVSEATNTSTFAGGAIWKNNTGAPLSVAYNINFTVAGSIAGSTTQGTFNMTYVETAGSTTARTYSWYAGHDGGPGVINSIGTDTSFGGQMSSIMTIMEIAA